MQENFNLELDPVNGRRLDTGGGGFWPNLYCDSDSIEIRGEGDIDELESAIRQTLKNIFLEFVRYFNWEMTPEQVDKWVAEFMKT